MVEGEIMHMWSRGLGKENLRVNLGQTTIKTFDEAVASMPDAARERLTQSINSNKKRCITLTGKIDPPVGWEYVILISIKDVFHLMLKMITLKLWRLFF